MCLILPALKYMHASGIIFARVSAISMVELGSLSAVHSTNISPCLTSA